jgi:hypothetical protein
MEKVGRNLEEQIRSIPALDLEPAEKVILKGKIEKKLFDQRIESAAQIETIIKVISDNELTDKQNYLTLLSEILKDIRNATGAKSE